MLALQPSPWLSPPRPSRWKAIGRMRGHQADAAFLHDLVSDHHAFVENFLVVLAGGLQMRHAGAVGEEEKYIFRRAVSNGLI